MSDTCTFQAPVFPLPISLPVNGYGGSLHDVVFWAPSYRHGQSYKVAVSTPLTWRYLDYYGARVSITSGIDGVALGMILVTLLYVVFLVPPAKRGKPFHVSLLLALCSQLLYFLLAAAQFASLDIGNFPAYRSITQDSSTTYSAGFKACRMSGSVLDLTALIATLICLFLQAHTALSILRVASRPYYLLVMGYLLLASMTTIVTKLLMLLTQAQSLFGFEPFSLNIFRAFSQAFQITPVITFCSFYIASIVSLMYTFVSRRKILQTAGITAHKPSPYERGLALLSLVLLQSCLVPIILVVVSRVSTNATVGGLVIPSFLVLLPFGGLYNTGPVQEQSQNQHHQHQNQQGISSQPQTLLLVPTMPQFNDTLPLRDDGRSEANGSGDTATSAVALVGEAPIDRELRAIDEL